MGDKFDYYHIFCLFFQQSTANFEFGDFFKRKINPLSLDNWVYFLKIHKYFNWEIDSLFLKTSKNRPNINTFATYTFSLKSTFELIMPISNFVKKSSVGYSEK